MTAQRAEARTVERQTAENVAVMLHRTGLRAKSTAHRVGMTDATLSRRLSGQLPWLLWEVQSLADLFGVTIGEMTTDLPPREEWEARGWYTTTDSNREPADMEDAAAGRRQPGLLGLPGAPIRHLRLVPLTVNSELTVNGLPGWSLGAAS